MRQRIIDFIKHHKNIRSILYRVVHYSLRVVGVFVPIKKKQILFASFGGRKYDDSPRALYEAICKDPYFANWEFVWAFTDPKQHEILKGKKIKMDSPSFFYALLSSQVWISNSGMDRGLDLCKRETISIETWHGTPFKKICGEENQNSVTTKIRCKKDYRTIRCTQSEYDRAIGCRVFNADESTFLKSDLPRNDELLRYTDAEREEIRGKLGILQDKKVILYMPTYREYLVDEKNACYFVPPIDFNKWEKRLGTEYVLLIRAHYAVSKAMALQCTDFLHDVSEYSKLNDLYAIADMLISDYSSAYVDYSILGRPMFCFAYDKEEYEEKRGLYIDLEKELPCPIDRNEDTLLDRMQTFDEKESLALVANFKQKYAPYAGNATEMVLAELKKRIAEGE